jgi:hypothetical protein
MGAHSDGAQVHRGQKKQRGYRRRKEKQETAKDEATTHVSELV